MLSVLMQVLTLFCVIALLWVSFGYSLAFTGAGAADDATALTPFHRRALQGVSGRRRHRLAVRKPSPPMSMCRNMSLSSSSDGLHAHRRLADRRCHGRADGNSPPLLAFNGDRSSSHTCRWRIWSGGGAAPAPMTRRRAICSAMAAGFRRPSFTSMPASRALSPAIVVGPARLWARADRPRTT